MATIIPRGKTYAVVYNYITEAGDKKQKWESGLTKQKAEERKAEIEYLQKTKQFIIPTGKTVEEFMKEWIPLQARRKKWAYKTYTSTLSLIQNHIFPHIGQLQIQKITRRDIDQLFDTLAQTPKGAFKNGKRIIPESEYENYSAKQCLSSSTLKDIFDILGSLFHKAMEYKLIRESPMPNDAPKRNTDYERSFWSDELMSRALHELEGHRLLHLSVHCAFVGALRVGETAGITTDCIDLEHSRIYIDKTLQRVYKSALKAIKSDQLIKVFPTVMEGKKTCLILKAPKTKKSKRFIFLTEPLKNEILERLKKIKIDKERLGDRYNDFGLLFCLDNGNPIEPNLMEKWFQDWQKEQGAKYPPLEFHGIRHSSSTYKLELSEGDYKSVQGDTGHSRADTLLNVYAHIQDKRRHELSQKFEKDFYKKEAQAQTPESKNFNRDLFYLLLEKAQDNPELQKEIFNLIKEEPELQKIALTAMISAK